jgi:murein DD-endopeptidase MepM/ murein hydrolase activator NlpD
VNDSSCIIGTGMAALAILSATAERAHAANSPSADIQIASRDGEDNSRQPESRVPAVAWQTVDTRSFAQVSFSRAADHDGQPVYYSRSNNRGSAGLVSFSPRKLPSGAIFSVALVTSRPKISVGQFSGSLPSLMPVAARRLTSSFGTRQHPILGTLRAHNGVDLAATYGSPIIATASGVVGTAGWSGGYGLLVSLDHGSGLQTRYGHMSRVSVTPGQQVQKGDVIGFVGSTGMSTGPHLHYEIRINGQAINPAAQLRGK